MTKPKSKIEKHPAARFFNPAEYEEILYWALADLRDHAKAEDKSASRYPTPRPYMVFDHARRALEWSLRETPRPSLALALALLDLVLAWDRQRTPQGKKACALALGRAESAMRQADEALSLPKKGSSKRKAAPQTLPCKIHAKVL
jgi:hypothetical protein